MNNESSLQEMKNVPEVFQVTSLNFIIAEVNENTNN